MKLLLLGKDGQVGRVLAPALRPLGEVVALGREAADFERPGELVRLVMAQGPDVVVNAAAYTAVDRAEAEPARARRVNAEAVAALAEAARRAGAWLVHYSTDYVFDGRKSMPYVETDPPSPLGVYGASKAEGDAAIVASGCRHLIFRVSWVYAGEGSNFPRTMLRLGRDREEIKVVADQVGAPTSARLITAVTANAVARLDGARVPESGLYHLSASGTVSRADFARFLVTEARERGAALALTPRGIVSIPTADFPTAAPRPLNSRLDTGKLRAAFGVALPDWREEARRFVATAMEAGI